MKRTFLLSVALSSFLFASGYQIPNSSMNSMALATANVANAHGADSAYYNPANMSFSSYKGGEIEIDTTYVYLPKIDYTSRDGTTNIQSQKEDAVIPSFHFVSKELNDNGVRVGFSIVSPAGLSREWLDAPGSNTAKKFELKTLEFNPSISLPISNDLAFGFGLRVLSAKGAVKFRGSDIDGSDSSSFGYNLALSYNATSKLNISSTYRSRIILNLNGYDNTRVETVSLDVPIPANFVFATAYKLDETTTIELDYDRTMWSALEKNYFDFDHTTDVTSMKNWHDSVNYRVGATHKMDNLTLMAGLSYGTNPSDEQYVSFSSPESDSMTYSVGSRYKVDKTLELGMAMLYADYKSRTATNSSAKVQFDGTFSQKSAIAVTLGANYKF